MTMPTPVEGAFQRFITYHAHAPVHEAGAYLLMREMYSETDQSQGIHHHWQHILPARVFQILHTLYRYVRLDKQTWAKREQVRLSYADLAKETGIPERTVRRILHRATEHDITTWQSIEMLTVRLIALRRAGACLLQDDDLAAEYHVSLADVMTASQKAMTWLEVMPPTAIYAPVPCPWAEGDFTYSWRGQVYELDGRTWTLGQLMGLFIRDIRRSVYHHRTCGHPVYGDTVFEVAAIAPLPPTAAASHQYAEHVATVTRRRAEIAEYVASMQGSSCAPERPKWTENRAAKMDDQSPPSLRSTNGDTSITQREESLPIAPSAPGKMGRSFPVGAETIGTGAIRETYQTRNGNECDGEQRSRIEQGTPPPLRATPPTTTTTPTVGKLLTAEEMDREAWLALARDEAGLAIATNYAALLYPRLHLLDELRSGDGEKKHPLQNLYLAKGEDDGDGDRYDGRQWYPATEDAPAEARTWWEIRKDIRSAVEQVLAAHAPHDGTKGTLPKHLAQLADRAKKKTDQYGAGIRGSRHGYYLTCLKNARREYQMKRGKMDELVKADAKGIVHGAARRDGVIVSLKAKPGRLPFGNGI